MRCWGRGTYGRLGYPTLDSLGNQANILDPSTTVPVDLGPGRTAIAISAGLDHTCALLDNSTVRCWGDGASGELGYCNTDSVGETDSPGSVGPVNLMPGDGGATCPGASVIPGPAAGDVSPSGPSPGAPAKPPATAGRSALRACLARAAHAGKRRRGLARRRCQRRYGSAPGAIIGLRASSAGGTAIRLFFYAPGTDGYRAPPADGYLVKQSTRPIRTKRDFRRAPALCEGDCIFALDSVGEPVELTVTNLRPHTTYYYALMARDGGSGRCGPRSRTVKATTGRPAPPETGGPNDGNAPSKPVRVRHARACQAP